MLVYLKYQKKMKNKKILILGISSFGGASFANYLLNQNKYNIIGTYNRKKNYLIIFF